MTDLRVNGSGSLVEALHLALRREILSGGCPPGFQVSEVGVGARFDVARPTAKAVIDRLISDGLLVRAGRKAANVPELSDKEIHDVYDARILIESAVHSSLAQSKTVPGSAVAANSALRAYAAAGDAAAVTESDVAFHQGLVRAYGNSRVERLHAMLMREAHLCMARVQAAQLLRADVIADEHATILQAITRGDPEEAKRLTEHHLSHAREKLLHNLRVSG